MNVFRRFDRVRREMVYYAPLFEKGNVIEMNRNTFSNIWWWHHGSYIRGPVAV